MPRDPHDSETHRSTVVSRHTRRRTRGTHFSLPDHGLQASIDGAGVVLGWRFLAAKDIEAGRVVEPFDLALPLGSSFYLAYPEAHSLRPNIAALRDWLVQEARES